MDIIKQPRKAQVFNIKNELAVSYNPLDPVEFRIFSFLVSQVEKGDRTKTHYRIPWKAFGIFSKDQLRTEAKVEAVLESMRKKSVQLRGEKVVAGFGYVAEYRIVVGQFADVQISEGMRDYIEWWKDGLVWTGGKLDIVLALPTTKAFQMYLFLARNRGRTKPFACSIDDLKFMFGIGDKQGYQSFGNLKQRILEPIKQVLDGISDLTFEYEPIKQSRKIVAIKFTVISKDRRQITIQEKLEKIIEEQLLTGPAPVIETRNNNGVYEPIDGTRFVLVVDQVEYVGELLGTYIKFDDENIKMIRRDNIEKMLKSGELRIAD